MVLSSVYCRGRTASKSNNGTIFFYCTFNEIYLLHNVLLCFLLTFMELPVRENGWGISQIPAGDGRSGLQINKPSSPGSGPEKLSRIDGQPYLAFPLPALVPMMMNHIKKNIRKLEV